MHYRKKVEMALKILSDNVKDNSVSLGFNDSCVAVFQDVSFSFQYKDNEKRLFIKALLADMSEVEDPEGAFYDMLIANQGWQETCGGTVALDSSDNCLYLCSNLSFPLPYGEMYGEFLVDYLPHMAEPVKFLRRYVGPKKSRKSLVCKAEVARNEDASV